MRVPPHLVAFPRDPNDSVSLLLFLSFFQPKRKRTFNGVVLLLYIQSKERDAFQTEKDGKP